MARDVRVVGEREQQGSGVGRHCCWAGAEGRVAVRVSGAAARPREDSVRGARRSHSDDALRAVREMLVREGERIVR